MVNNLLTGWSFKGNGALLSEEQTVADFFISLGGQDGVMVMGGATCPASIE